MAFALVITLEIIVVDNNNNKGSIALPNFNN